MLAHGRTLVLAKNRFEVVLQQLSKPERPKLEALKNSILKNVNQKPRQLTPQNTNESTQPDASECPSDDADRVARKSLPGKRGAVKVPSESRQCKQRSSYELSYLRIVQHMIARYDKVRVR